MTDSTVDLWAGYVRFVADRMRLRDWSFDIAYDCDLSGSDARIDVAPNRRFGLIRLSPRFFASGTVEQRYAVIHELAHPHFHRLRESIESARGLLSQSWPVVEATHANAIEDAAHEFTAMLAPFLPTFDEWNESRALPKLKTTRRSRPV